MSRILTTGGVAIAIGLIVFANAHPVIYEATGCTVLFLLVVFLFGLMRDAWLKKRSPERYPIITNKELVDLVDLRLFQAGTSQTVSSGLVGHLKANLPGTCQRASKGWECTRKAGHVGPCAAVPK